MGYAHKERWKRRNQSTDGNPMNSKKFTQNCKYNLLDGRNAKETKVESRARLREVGKIKYI